MPLLVTFVIIRQKFHAYLSTFNNFIEPIVSAFYGVSSGVCGHYPVKIVKSLSFSLLLRKLGF